MKTNFGLTTAGKDGKEVDRATGGEKLVIANVFDNGSNLGCSSDVEFVEVARKQGKKRHELAEYLTWLTRTLWDEQRVKAASGTFPKNEGKLRAFAFAGPESKVSNKVYSNKGTSYRQRLWKGTDLSGRWTYAHSLQGQALEIDREVMFAERGYPPSQKTIAHSVPKGRVANGVPPQNTNPATNVCEKSNGVGDRKAA
jgi:hypothetical protein